MLPPLEHCGQTLLLPMNAQHFCDKHHRRGGGGTEGSGKMKTTSPLSAGASPFDALDHFHWSLKPQLRQLSDRHLATLQTAHECSGNDSS